MKLSPKAVMGGLAVYFSMAAGTYIYLRSTKPPPQRGCPHHPKQDEEEEVFDRIADVYDTKIGFDETVMGVRLLRWWLMRQVQGDVLEVSAGTGRNLPYYRWDQIRSLTLTDTSRQMLLNAKEKFEGLEGGRQEPLPTAVKFSLGDGHRLVGAAGASGGSSGGGSSVSASSAAQQQQQQQQQGAEGKGEPQAAVGRGSRGGEEETRWGPALRSPQTFQPQSFDYVVDTFGLCSHDDPVQVLKEMARACKPGGKIVLLEHGRSSWGFVNRILDNGAAQHRDKWGCWWNRDIEGLIRKAGLKVDSMSRWHFGTTYVVVAESNPLQLQSWRARS